MTTSNPFRGVGFPPEVIEPAVWLHHCFSLSLRDVELILAAREIVVSYESIRDWGLRFDRIFANAIEVAPATTGRQVLHGRGVHPDTRQATLSLAHGRSGRRCSRHSGPEPGANRGKRFFRKVQKGLRYVPRVIITDKLNSYAAAKRKLLPSVEHRQSCYLNNRAEVSRKPTRRRERQMKRFKSARHAQRFL
jgi:putative transposase